MRSRRRSPGEPGRDGVVVAVLAASGMLTALQFTLIVPVLPLIPDLLGGSAADASWLVTITLLVGVVGTPVMTRLADLQGRRRMLLASMALLVCGSALAAAFPVLPATLAFPAVVAGRALQGFGTAVVPIGIALLTSLVSRRSAVLGISLMSGTLGVGSALGLTLAGPLVEWGGLAAVFWCTALLGALFLVLIARHVAEAPITATGGFDLWGAALLAVGLSALLLAISRGQSWGWTSAITLSLLAVAAVTMSGWMLWERRHSHPLIDVRTAMRPPISAINLASFFATFCMYANHLLTTQEALAPAATGYGLGAPTSAAGLLVVPSSVMMILLAPAAARLIDRVGGKASLVLGAAIMTLAFAFRVAFHADAVAVATGSALVGVGVAFAFAAMPALITASGPADQVAVANGVNSVVRTLSGAVAAALFGFVIAMLPSAASVEYLSHDALRLSLGGAAVCGAVTVLLAAFIRLPGTHPKETA